MKKLIKYKFVLLLSFLTLFSTSCEEGFLDINEDPLQASETQFSENPELLFSRFQAELGAERILESGNVFLFFTQHTAAAGSAGGTFLDPERYVVPDFPQIVSWGTYYINLLKNMQIGIELAEQGDAPNIAAVYKIMKAFVFYHITVSWEEAPFTQAVDFETQLPEFDDQETILRGIVALCDEANAQINLSSNKGFDGGQDFIFENDFSLWRRFANSLKFKTLMLIVNKDNSVSSEIANLIQNRNALMIVNNSQNALLPYQGSPTNVTNANQLWKLHFQFAGGTSAFLNASTTMIDLLDGDDNVTGNADDDPRLSTYYDEGSGADPGEFIGSVPGAADNFTNLADLSLNLIRPEEPDKWMMADEIVLLCAEAVARNLASGDAQALYEEGVRLNIDSYDGRPGEISEADEDNYVNNFLPPATVENIQIQQYLALHMRGVEAWTNVRRTGVPDLPLQ